MVNFWKPKTGKQLKPSRLNPWSISLDKPAKAFYGDSDGDRIMNMFDCQPKNRKKQGPGHDEEITGTRKQAMIDKEAYLRKEERIRKAEKDMYATTDERKAYKKLTKKESGD